MSGLNQAPVSIHGIPVSEEFFRGVRSVTPVLLGFLPFALALGAQASQKGLSALEVALMTGLNFGGRSEFAAIELWSSPVPVLVIVAITLLVNSRHLLMGAVFAPQLEHLPVKKAMVSLFFMCDESWAMSLADAKRSGNGPRVSLAYFLGVSVCLWFTWVSFTVLGVFIGSQFGDLHAYGFDMAFAAVFIMLLRGMWRGVHAAVPWLFSLVTAIAFYLLIPGAWYVLAGTVAGLVSAYLWAKA